MTKAKRRRAKVCNRCGVDNALNASECRECGSERFAPRWVIAKRTVNRQVGVEITESDPRYGDVQRRITLTKWWPGGNTSFHIPTVAQWDAIEQIINEELGPILGWRKQRELLEAVRERKRARKAVKGDLKRLIEDYPDFLMQVVSAVDPSRLSKDDIDQLVDVMRQLAEAMSGLDRGFKTAFLAIVKKLPREKQRALEDLEELLGRWSLQQITSVAQQVRQRIDAIELFKKQIQDDRTYEIRGANSIHRILERSMWLIDERYWLLHSNEPLRKFIGDEMAKADRMRFGKLRPDFVCGMVGERLMIIEIKRPGHTLTIDDLNQLETYLTVAESYKTFRGYEGYLIGNRIDDDLKRRQKHRSSSFKVWTYSDLLGDTEARYREYLTTLRS